MGDAAEVETARAGHDRAGLAGRLEQGRLDGDPELGPDEPDDVPGRLAAREFEERAGPVREVDDLVRLGDEHARRGRRGPQPPVDLGERARRIRLGEARRGGAVVRAARHGGRSVVPTPHAQRNGGGGRRALTALVDPVRLVDGDVGVLRRVRRLARPEEEVPAGLERVVEQLERALLEHALEVDEDVAARHQVDVRERRVLEEAVRREEDRLAEPLGHPVPARLVAKEAGEPRGAHVGLDGLGVEALARRPDGPLAEVGPEDLDGRGLGERPGVLEQEHGHGVRLLARRARGDPHADRVALALPLEQAGDDLSLQDRKRARVAEEVGDRDEEVLEELARLVGVVREVGRVGVERAGACDVEPALEPPQDGAPLVVREVVPRPRPEHGEDPLDGPELVVRERPGVVDREVDGPEPVRVRDRFGPERGGRGDRVDDARRDGAPGHLVVLGVGGVLGEDEPAGLLDGPHADGPVVAGPREDDGDGVVAPGPGERPEEVVDGPPQPPLGLQRGQPEVPVLHVEVPVRGDHVDAALLDPGPLGDLDDRDRDDAPEDLGHLGTRAPARGGSRRRTRTSRRSGGRRRTPRGPRARRPRHRGRRRRTGRLGRRTRRAACSLASDGRNAHSGADAAWGYGSGTRDLALQQAGSGPHRGSLPPASAAQSHARRGVPPAPARIRRSGSGMPILASTTYFAPATSSRLGVARPGGCAQARSPRRSRAPPPRLPASARRRPRRARGVGQCPTPRIGYNSPRSVSDLHRPSNPTTSESPTRIVRVSPPT